MVVSQEHQWCSWVNLTQVVFTYPEVSETKKSSKNIVYISLLTPFQSIFGPPVFFTPHRSWFNKDIFARFSQKKCTLKHFIVHWKYLHVKFTFHDCFFFFLYYKHIYWLQLIKSSRRSFIFKKNTFNYLFIFVDHFTLKCVNLIRNITGWSGVSKLGIQ